MSATTVETMRKVELERPRPTAVLIATDGTPQSDAAVAIAQLVVPNNKMAKRSQNWFEARGVPCSSFRRSRRFRDLMGRSPSQTRAHQGGTMYKVIMAPTEGSDSERGAISVAVKLAHRFDADLRLVRVKSEPLVIEPFAQMPVLPTEEMLREERVAHLRKLEALGSECRALGEIRVMTALEDGPLGPTLRDYALKFNVDLIVMSSHARGGMKRIALGSVTDYLIRRTNIPVLVVRPPVSFIGVGLQQEPASRIVVPLDGSQLAEEILPGVAALALRLGSTVSLLHVLAPISYSQKEIMQPGLPWWDADIAAADAYLARAASYLTNEGLAVSKDVVLSDNIATAILDYSARMRADIIALATNGTGGMSRFVFGTVADEVTRKSTTSLLVFHPKTPVEVADTNEHTSTKALAGV